jgi:hypothetical protein
MPHPQPTYRENTGEMLWTIPPERDRRVEVGNTLKDERYLGSYMGIGHWSFVIRYSIFRLTIDGLPVNDFPIDD